MAYKNQVIENKTFGDRLVFLVTSEDSKGEMLKVEMAVKPGGDGPPEHYHPVQSESFEVLRGELSVVCYGKKYIIKEGETFTVPANAPHKWWNEASEELLVNVELRPALKSEYFFETIYSLDMQGKADEKGLPNLLQFAAVLNECYGELFVVGPPIPAQRFMAKVIGGFAKLIGYKGYIPFPKR